MIRRFSAGSVRIGSYFDIGTKSPPLPALTELRENLSSLYILNIVAVESEWSPNSFAVRGLYKKAVFDCRWFMCVKVKISCIVTHTQTSRGVHKKPLVCWFSPPSHVSLFLFLQLLPLTKYHFSRVEETARLGNTLFNEIEGGEFLWFSQNSEIFRRSIL